MEIQGAQTSLSVAQEGSSIAEHDSLLSEELAT